MRFRILVSQRFVDLLIPTQRPSGSLSQRDPTRHQAQATKAPERPVAGSRLLPRLPAQALGRIQTTFGREASSLRPGATPDYGLPIIEPSPAQDAGPRDPGFVGSWSNRRLDVSRETSKIVGSPEPNPVSWPSDRRRSDRHYGGSEQWALRRDTHSSGKAVVTSLDLVQYLIAESALVAVPLGPCKS